MASSPSAAARAANGLGALAFLACAAVQLNDPDPARWVAIYGLSAALCAAAALGRPLRLPAAAVAGGAAAWAVVVLVAFARSAEGWTDELAREAGGLALVVGWMGGLARSAPGRRLRDGSNRAK